MATSISESRQKGMLPRALSGMNVGELMEFSRFLKWSHQMACDEGQLPPSIERDPDVALGDDWDGWISFYIMGHERGPELAAVYYLDASQQVPREVWGHTELLAPDDPEDIARRLRLGNGSGGRSGSVSTAFGSTSYDVHAVD